MQKQKLICVVGPTASGKTDAGIWLAKEIGGEIIAADSRTVYKGMNIGTAKPKGEVGVVSVTDPATITSLFTEKPYMVEGVPHWGIDIVNPDQPFTVADFQVYADQKIQEIADRGNVPMLVGGTGLYIEAVVDNYAFSEDEKTAKHPSRYNPFMIGLLVDRDELNERIDARVDAMVAGGLVDEVRGLKNQYGCEAKSMTGIGYRQICAFLDGYIKLRDAIDLVKRETKQYVKRQRTWFKRDDRIRWVTNIADVLEDVKKFIVS